MQGKEQNDASKSDAAKRRSQHGDVGDFGYGGHERGAEADDRVQREAYPNQRPPKSAYSSIVGEIAVLRPGDVAGASKILERVRAAIEHGGWTRNEWRRLYRLETKWHVRSLGNDRRFNLVGNRKTGLNREQNFEVKCGVSVQEIAEVVDSTRRGYSGNRGD